MVIILLAYGILGAVLFYHQVLTARKWAQQAVAARSRAVELEEVPRGNILDRNGIPLTGTNVEWALYGLPQTVRDVRQTAEELGKTLDWDHTQVKAAERRLLRAVERRESLVLLRLPLSARERYKLARTDIEGTVLLPVVRRYDEKGFACHLLGEVQLFESAGDKGAPNAVSGPEAQWVGVSGIEKRYDEVLRGLKGSEGARIAVVVDARGNPILGLSPRIQGKGPGSKGAGVVLTVDRRVQKIVEDVMNRRVKKGAVVVVDVGTRDILAMASRPTYNYYRETKDLKDEQNSPFINRAFALYHPGSIFKLVVAACALDQKVVSLKDTWNCTGSFSVNDRVAIGCWKREGHGLLRLDEGLAYSCNSVFIQVGLKLGRERLVRHAEQLHLTESEIIGYPGLECQGYVRIEPGPAALGNASIGQEGVMLSPVQVASLVATIADDGKWTPVRLVRGVRRADGEWERRFGPLPKQQVINQETARKLKDMLELAVNKGTGKKARLNWCQAAGKTASSQTGRFSPEGKEVLNAWFAGYLPAESPRWVIVVLAEEGISGGESAAPVFQEIGNELARLFSG